MQVGILIFGKVVSGVSDCCSASTSLTTTHVNIMAVAETIVRKTFLIARAWRTLVTKWFNVSMLV
jgi:hypothetical protein